ncbi:Ubiquitin-like protein 3 [Geodia barretti]|uniref:Ubiquitin-like protein 3 n=1 Tax=Geodia barretti TaxID=519541 RepID=A0AA35RB47_GEOBA|nr:Ubiquitin-like protein 3 [Geodia barretti]
MPEIPKDKINLKILLVDGSTHTFLYPALATGAHVAQDIHQSWPSVWSEATVKKPERPDVLRLIYRGRFLHQATTLSSLSLPLGKTTVMHMIVRDRLPEEQNTESTRVRTKVVTADHQAQSSCCTIL